MDGDKIEKGPLAGGRVGETGDSMAVSVGGAGLKGQPAPGFQRFSGQNIGLALVQRVGGVLPGVGDAVPGHQLSAGGHDVVDGKVLAVQHLIDAVIVQVCEVIYLHPDPVGLGLDIERGLSSGPVDVAAVPDGVVHGESAGAVPAVQRHMEVQNGGVGGLRVDQEGGKGGGKGIGGAGR